MSKQSDHFDARDSHMTELPQARGLLSGLLLFARENWVWWAVPLGLVLLAVALLVILGGSDAAPFVYTLF